jgi:hypothetical protein
VVDLVYLLICTSCIGTNKFYEFSSSSYIHAHVIDTSRIPDINDQISIKTPIPKCQLFLKIDQYMYLGRGVGGWGGGVGEPERRLEGR